MTEFRQGIMNWIRNIAGISSLIALTPSLAADPHYVFSPTEDHQPDLCGHMKIVFDNYFKHMWTDPVATDTLDAIYSGDGAYAFSLLPNTKHETRMTMEMRYSKVPSSPEFDAIPWREGHTIFGGGTAGATDNNSSYLLPYLIAYVDIDNDGVLDTIVKEGFSKGYAWMFSRENAEAGIGETLLTFRDTKLDQSARVTLSELIHGSESYGKPIYSSSGYLRPFIYQKKTYVASYQQGYGEKPTEQSRANLRRNVPPHERMFISSYSYKAAGTPIDKSQWTVNTLCIFDMIQAK